MEPTLPKTVISRYQSADFRGSRWLGVGYPSIDFRVGIDSMLRGHQFLLMYRTIGRKNVALPRGIFVDSIMSTAHAEKMPTTNTNQKRSRVVNFMGPP
jgi:hypothetical protein